MVDLFKKIKRYLNTLECSYEISDTLKMLVIDKATLGNNGKFGGFFVVMKMNVYQRFKVDDSVNSLGFNS